MPLKAKLDGDGEEGGTVHASRPGGNGYDGAKLKNYLDRVANCQAEIDKIMDDAKDACAPHRDDIAAIKKEAAEAGFSKTEFAAVLRKSRLEQRLEHVADSLDSEQKETYEQMLVSLAGLQDTPLGKAALEGAAAH